MKIRRYMASNMQEALLKVKMDLGSDAVILNTRKVHTVNEDDDLSDLTILNEDELDSEE